MALPFHIQQAITLGQGDFEARLRQQEADAARAAADQKATLELCMTAARAYVKSPSFAREIRALTAKGVRSMHVDQFVYVAASEIGMQTDTLVEHSTIGTIARRIYEVRW